jgi:thymidylate synthase (FAD)
MKTKLISITQPIISGVKTAEDLISYCARVSNPTNQLNTETAPKLLKYLIDHKHWSPMEMVSMTVEIKTSRAIAAQILRHRSFSFQEFSQRYSTATVLEDIEWRMQGRTNRQVGDQEVDLSEVPAELVKEAQDKCLEAYNYLIKIGVAKECARMVLPLNTSTTIYMNGTVRSWIHYLDIRCKDDTQKEHRDIALDIQSIFIDNFPNISSALNWTNKI